MFFLLISLPILGALLLSLLVSMFSLFWGWRNGPKLSKNIPICVLGIAFGVFLWTVMVLPLFEVSVNANNLDDFEGLLLYMVLYGATPLAAFPALFLFGPRKKSSDPK